MQVAKEELSLECDYELEARSQKRFRELLCTAKGVYVPLVIDDLSSKRVLTTEFVSGNFLPFFITLSNDFNSALFSYL